VLRYDWPEGQELTYDLKIEVEAEDLSYSYGGSFTLKCLARKDERMKIQYRGSLRQTKGPAKQLPDDPLKRHRDIVSRLRGSSAGAAFATHGSPTNVIWVNPQGHVKERVGISRLPLMMELASDVVFEPLPDTPRQSWEVGAGILLELAGKEPPRPSFSRPRETPPTRQITLKAEHEYEILRTEGDTVVVQKHYTLTPPDSDLGREIPKITGSGIWKFNLKLNASESLEFDQQLVLTKGSLKLTVPVKLSYRLVPEIELAQRREEERRRAEEARRRAEEARATMPRPAFRRMEEERERLLAEARARFEAARSTRGPGPVLMDREKRLEHLKSGDARGMLPTLKSLWYKLPAEPDEELAAAITSALEHPNRDIRHAAAVALRNFGTAKSIPGLISATDDEDISVRHWVLVALGRLKAEQALEAIAHMLESEEDVDRGSASEALKRIGIASGPTVVARLKHAAPAVRREACRILGAIDLDAETAQAAMTKLLSLRDDPLLADDAGRALAAVSSRLSAKHERPAKDPPASDNVVTLLRQASVSSDEATRSAATRLLGALGLSENDSATPAATENIQPPKPAAVVDSLQALLRDQDAAARYWSCRALGALGTHAEPEISDLVAACQDTDPAVRYAAVQATSQVARSVFGEDTPVVAAARKIAEQINALPSGTESSAKNIEKPLRCSLMQLWPVAADRPTASGSRGVQSTTGPDSAEWFGYGGAGNWRVFEVKPNQPLLLKTRAEGLLRNIQFTVSEYEDGKWVAKQTIAGPTNFNGLHWFFHTPSGDRMRIDAKGWFHLYVYQL